ncbi:anti-sigma factor [Paenibacillus sp. MCAF9]|uniref:anti-sigma factor family protein n=1 Tax=unclassified Paenibacillus TaxID=185978 RepID=UPI003F9B5DFB
MNCQEVMELMQRQLDNDLDESEIEVLMNHTRQCPDCAAMFERLQLLSAELTSLPKVMPSYSLVDAIMPQLERMELFGQAEAEPPSMVSRTEATKRLSKRQRRWPSMRIMSGVIAAGIVAGLFLVTYNSGSIGDMNASQSSAKRSNNVAADMMNDTPVEMSYKASANGAEDPEVKTETAKKSDEADSSPSSKSTAINPLTNEDKAPDGGSFEDGSIKGLTSNPSEGLVENEGENGLGANANSTATVSPDGLYSGKADNFKIKVVAAADQSVVFTSPRKNGELLNLAWSEDSKKLTYEVHVEQGAIEKYVIDLSTLTEQKAGH